MIYVMPQKRAKKENEQTIMMGNWKSNKENDYSMEKRCMKRPDDETINRNGKIVFCITNDLLTGNTFGHQYIEDKYTLVAEERQLKNVIDYIVYTPNLIKDIQHKNKRKSAHKIKQ